MSNLTLVLLFCLIALGLTQFIPASADTSLRNDHVQYKIRRGEMPVRGVNLGSWLVVERWMSGSSPVWKDVPDKIANTGEYQTMKLLGHAEGDKRFEEHRSTWITDKDFAEIKKFGLNTVRVPVGYWIMEKDTDGGPFGNDWKMFAPGSLKYLDMAMQWGRTYNLSVFVDIHAAKGSENGMDHSSPTNPGISSWADFPENVNHTLNVADFLVTRYKDEPAFLGLGLLNEPFGNTSVPVLRDFYIRAYKRIRQYSDCVLVHMPLLGEQDPGHWQDFCTEKEGYKNFWHEWHKYLLWGYEWADDDQVIQQAETGLYYMIRAFTGTTLFNGEWSLGTSPKAPFKDEEKFKKFSAAYVRALEGCPAGWTYWSWRTSFDEQDKRDPWSMRQMLRRGYIKW